MNGDKLKGGTRKLRGEEPKSGLGRVFNFKNGRVCLYLAIALITKAV